MKTKKKRIIYLDLFRIRLPLMAMTSLLHRVSGVILFCMLAPAIYLLQLSLISAEGFSAATSILNEPVSRILLILTIWAFAHHFAAGIRILFLDINLGISRAAARRSAVIAGFFGIASLGVVLAVRSWV